MIDRWAVSVRCCIDHKCNRLIVDILGPNLFNPKHIRATCIWVQTRERPKDMIDGRWLCVVVLIIDATGRRGASCSHSLLLLRP